MAKEKKKDGSLGGPKNDRVGKKKRSLGQVTYEAYCEYFQVLGHKPTKWKNLSPKLKQNWEYIGQTVSTYAVAHIIDRHRETYPLFVGIDWAAPGSEDFSFETTIDHNGNIISYRRINPPKKEQ